MAGQCGRDGEEDPERFRFSGHGAAEMRDLWPEDGGCYCGLQRQPVPWVAVFSEAACEQGDGIRCRKRFDLRKLLCGLEQSDTINGCSLTKVLITSPWSPKTWRR